MFEINLIAVSLHHHEYQAHGLRILIGGGAKHDHIFQRFFDPIRARSADQQMLFEGVSVWSAESVHSESLRDFIVTTRGVRHL